jgi:WD40 repeat protein
MSTRTSGTASPSATAAPASPASTTLEGRRPPKLDASAMPLSSAASVRSNVTGADLGRGAVADNNVTDAASPVAAADGTYAGGFAATAGTLSSPLIVAYGSPTEHGESMESLLGKTQASMSASVLDKSCAKGAIEAVGVNREYEFDRRNVALERSEHFVPVNPFQGEIVEMPDPLDDTVLGVVLSEEQILERQRTKAFEESNHSTVEHRTVAGFNFNRGSRGNRAIDIVHVEEDSICFSAGRHIHISHLTNSLQHRVQQRTPRCIEVLAFAVSSNGKYIAISERMADAPHVTIYKTDSTTRIASLNFKHLTQTYVEHVTFSSNNNFLLTSTAQPHQRLIMWQLSDVKVIGVLDEWAISSHTCKLPGKHTPQTATFAAIRVNPWSSFQIATASDQGLSIWKLNGRAFANELHVSTVSPRAGTGGNVFKASNTLTGPVPSPSNRQSATAHSPASTALGAGSDDEQIGHLRPVTDVCFYDEQCCAALTADGTLVAVENQVVTQRLRLRVPVTPAAVQRSAGGHDTTEAAGGTLTPLEASLTQSPAASPKSGSHSPTSAGFAGSLAASFLSASVNGAMGRPPPMKRLAWASRGLLCCGDDGVVILLDRTYAEPTFVQTCVFRVGASPARTGLAAFPSVQSCSVSPGETNVVLGLSDNTVFSFIIDDLNDAISHAEAAAEERAAEAAEAGGRTDLFQGEASASGSPRGLTYGLQQPVGARFARQQELAEWQSGILLPGVGAAFIQPAFVKAIEHLCFHKEPITSLTTCTQRPLVCTTSRDRTVRIFDYEKNTFILTERVEDEIISGALHPTGLHLVLCFRFYSRVYAILPKGLHMLEDINIKPAYEVRFSSLGGRIAFAVNNRVILVDAHSYRIVGGLVGHASSIKSIAFSPRDDIITTSDVAGVIMMWDAASMLRTTQESSQKNLIFQQAFIEPQSGLFCAFGSTKHAKNTTFEGEVTFACSKPGEDQTIVYVRPGMVLPRAQATRKQHYQLMTITRASQTLIVGTPTGRLLLYSWPLLKTSKPYLAVDSHCVEITHLLVSPDERFLFTVGADCVMYVYDLLHLREGRYVHSVTFNWSLFDPVVLQHASDSDQLDRDTFVLRERLEDKTREKDASVEGIRKARETDMKARVAHYDRAVERLRRQIDSTASAMHTNEKATTDRAHAIEANHAAAAEEIEVLYSKRARDALGRINRIESEREELAAQYEAKVVSRQNEIVASRQRMEAKIAERERQLADVTAKLHEQLRQNVKKDDAMLAQTIADYETQLKRMDVDHTTRVAKNDERTLRAANTANFGDREAERLRREIVDLQSEVVQRKIQCNDLQTGAHRRDKENKVLKKELLVKQEAINQGEKRMLALKQQLSKLENLRFVLTHQYEELRRAYIPKDGDIQALELRLQETEVDLQKLSFERNQVRDQVMHIDERLQTQTDASAKLRVSAIDQERRTKNVMDGLGRLLDTYKDAATLHKELEKVVANAHKSMPEAQRIVSVPEDSAKHQKTNTEMHRQVDFLGAKLQGLQREERRYDAGTAALNQHRIEQNNELIVEIQALRRDRKELRTTCSLFEQQLRDTCVALYRLSDPRRTAHASPEMGSPVTATPATGPHKGAPALLPPISKSQSKFAPTDDSDDSDAAAVAHARPHSRATSVKAHRRLPPKPASSSATPPSKKQQPAVLAAAKGSQRSASSPAKRTASPSRPSSSSPPASHPIQTIIDQLDANTDRMRRQQHDVFFLRNVVQELLQQEEARLLSELKSTTPAGDFDLVVAEAGPTPSPAPTNAPYGSNLRAASADGADSFTGPTPGLDDDDDVDWTVPGVDAPRPASSQSQADDGRPMTPTRLPAAGL